MGKRDYQEILSRKLKELIPDDKLRAEALAVLEGYGTEDYEQEPCRVRLAVLKLAGADLEVIRTTTEQAKQDFRDILAWAEYPRQSKSWSLQNSAGKQKLIAADKAEYDEWLNS